jgi:hypothetical protein
MGRALLDAHEALRQAVLAQAEGQRAANKSQADNGNVHFMSLIESAYK